MLLNQIRNRIGALRRAGQVIKHHHPEMRNDPLFDLVAVNRGFEPRPSSSISAENLHRIMRAYRKAKEAQKSAAPHYLVDNEWLPIYRAQFKDSMLALEQGDEPSIRKMYENFFRDPVSSGLHGMPVNMERTYFSERIEEKDKLLYLIDSLYRYRLWQKLTSETRPDALVRPDVGNPYGILFEGRFITPALNTNIIMLENR